MSDFIKYCDEFFAQDVPFDSGSIQAVKDNQAAIWDETAPSVVTRFNHALEDGGSDEGHRWASAGRQRCVFLRPYLLRPGVESIKITLYGHSINHAASTTADTILMWVGVGFKADIRAETQIVQGVSGTDAYTTFTVPVKQVSAPELTMVQVWVQSEYDEAPTPNYWNHGNVWDTVDLFTSNIATLFGTELSKELGFSFPWSDKAIGYTWDEPADIDDYPQMYALGWIDLNGDIQDAQTVIEVRRESTIADNKMDLIIARKPDLIERPEEYPASFNLGDGGATFTVSQWALATSSYYVCKLLAITEVREDSSTALGTVAAEFIIPGNLPEFECVAGLLGTGYRLANEVRPIASGAAVEGGGIGFEITTNPKTVTVEAGETIQIMPPTSGSVSVYFILLARSREVEKRNLTTVRMTWTAYQGVTSVGTGYAEVGLPTRVAAIDSLTGNDQKVGWSKEEVDHILAESDGAVSYGKVVIDGLDTSYDYGDGNPKPILLELAVSHREGPVYAGKYTILPLVLSEPSS